MEKNGGNIADVEFKSDFSNENWLILIYFFIEVCPLACDLGALVTGLDDGFALNRRQAFIKINDDPIHRAYIQH